MFSHFIENKVLCYWKAVQKELTGSVAVHPTESDRFYLTNQKQVQQIYSAKDFQILASFYNVPINLPGSRTLSLFLFIFISTIFLLTA